MVPLLITLALLGVALPIFLGIFREIEPKGGWLAGYVRHARRGRRYDLDRLRDEWADDDDLIDGLEVLVDRDLDGDGEVG